MQEQCYTSVIHFVTFIIIFLQPVNPSIKKESPKVVDGFDIEELGESTAFCRCWRSSKFPLCDGAHNKYNIEQNDNVGPLLIKKK